MTKLQERFLLLRQLDADSRDPSTWWKYEFSPKTVEELAHKYINEELKKDSLPEYITVLSSCCVMNFQP